jgi:PAS domain S-box-containing protein
MIGRECPSLVAEAIPKKTSVTTVGLTVGMYPLTAITVLFLWVSASWAQTPPLASISDIAAKGPGAFPQPVRSQGTVTYFDPTRRCLALQDGEVGMIVKTPLDNRPLKIGQRAEVRGKVLATGYLDASDARPVGDDRIPAPLYLSGAEFAGGKAMNRRVRVSGVIRSGVVEGDHAVVRLIAGRQPIRVFIKDLPAGPISWARYVDAEVDVVGVCGPNVNDRGELDGLKLLVQHLDHISVQRAAPDPPFSLAPTPLAKFPVGSFHRIRVDGVATGPVIDGVLSLREGDRTVRVAVGPTTLATAGERFEAVGFPTQLDGKPYLDDAVVRGFAPSRPTGAIVPHDTKVLPVVQSIAEIRRMSVDDANRGYPVRLRTTLTYHDVLQRDLFVHDGVEGIYVFPPEKLGKLPAGATVQVDGYSEQGGFTPSIRATRITVVHEGQLPEARKFSFNELEGGREDCQWVEIDAVVRGTGRSEYDVPSLMLRFGPMTVSAQLAGIDPESLRTLFGATVRLRAVCGTRYNDRRQWEGLLFFVPSPDAISIRKPAPADLSTGPPQTVESLLRFDPERGPGEAAKLSGIIVARRGSTVFLQDSTGGIAVQPQPGQPAEIGDHVEVLGFLVHTPAAISLEDGLFRRIPGPVDDPVVRDVTPHDVIGGTYAATLIRLHGVLVDHFPASAVDYIFLLRDDSDSDSPIYFPVVLPRGELTPELLALRPGTRLRIVGGCSMPNDRQQIASFRVYLRNASDLKVINRPSRWTIDRVLVVAGVVAALAIVAWAWVITLRGRVRRQTKQIHERYESETRLEEQYRDLFESASDAVFTLDPFGEVIAMNQAGRLLTGLKSGDAFLSAVVSSSENDARELLTCREPITREISLNGPDGIVILEVSARPLLDGHTSSGVQAIARDLTHRRRLEMELRQAQKMEVIGRLAGGVAHDFNNLLTVINGNAEVLRTRLTASDSELADEIARAGEHAAALTGQLLAFSRKDVVAPRIVCPSQTIARIQPMLSRMVGERVQVAIDLDEDSGCVMIDPGQLQQVLINLAVNSRDAMLHGGTLTIRTRARPNHIRVEMIDTGMGMDAATKARVFEPFFTTKAAGAGTGLGLATVRGIIEQAGGSIGVNSEPGQGTTFVIDLPRVEGEPVSPLPTPVPEPSSSREVILLVEDEPAVQLLERRVLEMGRYQVLVASSGEEALAIFAGRAGRIDLLVTDVVMPGMTGRELAEAIARRRPGLPTLFLSGYNPDEVLRQGIRAEEAHFLQKPFTPSSLLAKVREVLRQKQTL